MKVNRVSEIIECLYLNNLISKKYKMIFQNQYDYLENEELLKKMGIILKKDNSICDKRGLIVDVNNNLRCYDQSYDNKIRCKYKIKEFNYAQFVKFRKSSLIRFIMSLLNECKIYFLFGLVLYMILLLGIYIIIANLKAIIDTAFTINSKYIFETCVIVSIGVIFLSFIVILLYRYIYKLITKVFLIKRHIYIEKDDDISNYEDIKLYVINNLNGFCNSIISVISIWIGFVVLFFFSNTTLKFCFINLLSLISLCVLMGAILKPLGFYDYIKCIRKYKKYKQSNDLLVIKKFNRIKSFLAGCTTLFFIVILVETFVYTSYQIFNDKLSIGSQFLTIVFNFLISYPFYTIARNFSNYVEIIIFLREMKFKEKEDNRDIEEIILPQKLQLNNICFGYDENVILKNIFLNIDPLIVIEIFGKSGCGKKTLAKILMQKQIADSGELLFNGVDSKYINSDLFDCMFGYISFCCDFEGISIKNYFLKGNNYSPKEFTKILNKLQFLSYLRRYPDYVDTVINEKSELSNSEIVLILIAKAIFDDKKILILDNLLGLIDKKIIDELFIVIKEMKLTVVLLENNYIECTHISKYYELSDCKLKDELL